MYGFVGGVDSGGGVAVPVAHEQRNIYNQI